MGTTIDSCVICLTDLNIGDTTRLMCEHVFHNTCLSTLLDQPNDIICTCPVCRKFISKGTIIIQQQQQQQQPNDLVESDKLYFSIFGCILLLGCITFIISHVMFVATL